MIFDRGFLVFFSFRCKVSGFIVAFPNNSSNSEGSSYADEGRIGLTISNLTQPDFN